MSIIIKRLFFEYEIPPRYKITRLNLKIPLLNTNFSKLLYLSPDATITNDNFGNLYAECSFNHTRDFLFVEYGFEDIKSKLPSGIFRPIDKIIDYYTAPEYDVQNLAERFRSANLPLKELSIFVRENFDLNVNDHHCEHYAKIIALVASTLGYRCACITGYLDEEVFEKVEIRSLGKVFEFPSFTGHKWTLINNGSLCYIGDPSVIPGDGKRRFVDKVNSNKDLEYRIEFTCPKRNSDHNVNLHHRRCIEIKF